MRIAAANPNKVAFIAADGASNEEEVTSVALGNNGPSDIEVIAKWGTSEIGKKMVKIRTFDSIEINSTWSEWWDFFVSLGYRTHYVWEIADQFGQPIGNVGVNEDLDYPNRQIHVDNNWFNSGVVTRNDETTAAGYFEDQYSVNSILGSRHPEPIDPDWLPTAASIKVATVPQRYFLGSKTSEDGVQMRAHNVCYHRGFATVED